MYTVKGSIFYEVNRFCDCNSCDGHPTFSSDQINEVVEASCEEHALEQIKENFRVKYENDISRPYNVDATDLVVFETSEETVMRTIGYPELFEEKVYTHLLLREKDEV